MKKHNYEIGDIITDKEFQDLKKSCTKTSFDGVGYTLQEDLMFEREKIGDDDIWRLTSTYKQRMSEDDDTGFANIIKLSDNTSRKSYYDKLR